MKKFAMGILWLIGGIWMFAIVSVPIGVVAGALAGYSAHSSAVFWAVCLSCVVGIPAVILPLVHLGERMSIPTSEPLRNRHPVGSQEYYYWQLEYDRRQRESGERQP